MYIHTSPNGKRYIGITCRRPKKRWRRGNGYPQNTHFTAAVQKYGWDNFTHEIVARDLSQADACALEQKLIGAYQTTNPEYGYNHSPGGELLGRDFTLTEQQRRFASERVRGEKNPNYGKRMTVEQKQKLRESCSMGEITRTPEWNKHISEALVGRKFTEDRKKQISSAMVRVWTDSGYRENVYCPCRQICSHEETSFVRGNRGDF